MGYFRENIEELAGYEPGFQPKATDVVKLETMKSAVVEGFLKKLGKSKAEHNGECVEQGYDSLILS